MTGMPGESWSARSRAERFDPRLGAVNPSREGEAWQILPKRTAPELRSGESLPGSDRGNHGPKRGSAGSRPGKISPASCRRPGAHCRPLDPASLSLSPLLIFIRRYSHAIGVNELSIVIQV